MIYLHKHLSSYEVEENLHHRRVVTLANSDSGACTKKVFMP